MPVQSPSVEELLKQIAETEKEVKRYAKRQYWMTFAAALCSVLMLGILLTAYFSLAPRLKTTLDAIEDVSGDLTNVSRQLSDANLEELVDHVDEMAVTSEEGIKRALEQIEAIDIDELNKAIKALSDVVSPLARLVNRFN